MFDIRICGAQRGGDASGSIMGSIMMMPDVGCRNCVRFALTRAASRDASRSARMRRLTSVNLEMKVRLDIAATLMNTD